MRSCDDEERTYRHRQRALRPRGPLLEGMVVPLLRPTVKCNVSIGSASVFITSSRNDAFSREVQPSKPASLRNRAGSEESSYHGG